MRFDMQRHGFVSVVSIFLLVVPLVGFAQPVAEEQLMEDGLPAHVYVRNLKVDKTEYKSGEVVRGSFELYNVEAQIVSDAYYVIRLMGAYSETGRPGVLYAIDTRGPVFLDSNQQRAVDFEYQLPSTVAGKNVGIQVQAMLKTGLPMGWEDARFSIAGESKFLDVGLALLQIKDKQFGVEEGPTVAKGEEITANASLHNPAKNPITVTPVVTVYDRSIATEALSTTKHDPVTVAPDEVKKISLKLPTFDDTARVYAGTVEFVGEDGKPHGNPFSVRYIVEGEIAAIERISTTRQSVREGEDIPLVVDVSAAPVHFGSSGTVAVQKIGPATFTIQVLNERDQVVAQTTQELDLDERTVRRFITLTAQRDARQLKIRSTVAKGDKELSNYETDLELEALPAGGFPAAAGKGGGWKLLVILGAGTLLAIAFYLIARKDKSIG